MQYIKWIDWKEGKRAARKLQIEKGSRYSGHRCRTSIYRRVLTVRGRILWSEAWLLPEEPERLPANTLRNPFHCGLSEEIDLQLPVPGTDYCVQSGHASRIPHSLPSDLHFSTPVKPCILPLLQERNTVKINIFLLYTLSIFSCPNSYSIIMILYSEVFPLLS